MKLMGHSSGVVGVACASLSRTGTFAVVLAVAVMSGQRAHAQPGTVLSHQEISDTMGEFMGILDNVDRFGRTPAAETATSLQCFGTSIPRLGVTAFLTATHHLLVRPAAGPKSRGGWGLREAGIRQASGFMSVLIPTWED